MLVCVTPPAKVNIMALGRFAGSRARVLIPLPAVRCVAEMGPFAARKSET